ncbi:agamous-like MADS-box protein AGL61 [Lycium barbarum]|uniref:agamous-like MADS-box protein AGL61 n=1 Tax=Lycium barbarum TaxID=112863 RepID=UPI00293E7156|nr:agamous-like MADS-box protein AGL61 [Lycium barbarum]
MENNEKKRSRGRQKIAIEKIANKNSLQVTFSKRRTGLFKKASQLSALCGAQVAVIVESPAGKIFSFGNPSVDSVIHRYETGDVCRQQDVFNDSWKKYLDSKGDLEEAQKKEKESMGKSNWWEDLCVENLGLQELEECMAAMQLLKKNLLKRSDDVNSSDDDHDGVLIPNMTFNQFGALPLQYYDVGGRSN